MGDLGKYIILIVFFLFMAMAALIFGLGGGNPKGFLGILLNVLLISPIILVIKLLADKYHKDSISNLPIKEKVVGVLKQVAKIVIVFLIAWYILFELPGQLLNLLQ